MLAKNVSGAALRLSLGVSFAGSLPSNGTVSVPDTDPIAIGKIVELARAGKLDILTAPVGSDLHSYNDLPAHLLIHFGNGTTRATNGSTITMAGEVLTLVAGANAVADAEAVKVLINSNSVLVALGVVARDVINSQGQASTTRATLFVDLSAVRDYTSFAAGLAASATAVPIAYTAAALSQGAQRLVIRQVAATGASTTVSPVVATGLRDAQSAFALVKTSAGAIKPINGVVRLSGSLVSIDLSGDADVAATDQLLIFAFGY